MLLHLSVSHSVHGGVGQVGFPVCTRKKGLASQHACGRGYLHSGGGVCIQVEGVCIQVEGVCIKEGLHTGVCIWRVCIQGGGSTSGGLPTGGSTTGRSASEGLPIGGLADQTPLMRYMVYYRIQSASGQYASYWNAFLYHCKISSSTSTFKLLICCSCEEIIQLY